MTRVVIRTQSFQVSQVLAVHRQYVIVMPEIPGMNLTRPQDSQIITPRGRLRSGARIGRFTNMPGTGAAGIYLHLVREPALSHQ